MASHDTWMPLYVGDYLADTMHLTTRQHGAYMLLLMHAWRNGGNIPTSEAAQAAIVRAPTKEWAKDAEIVLEFFDFDPEGKDGIWHQRVRDELAVAEAMTQQRSKAGKASAAKRERERQRKANENPTPVEQAMDSRTKPSQSPSPSPSVTTSLPASTSAHAHRLPKDWKPSDEDRTWAAKARPDLTPALLDAETERFRNHAEANNRTAHSWGPNWRNWISKASAVEPPKPAKGDTPRTIQHDTEDQWRGRIRGWRPGKFWHRSDWGPEPGQPGCRVPKPILEAWETTTKTGTHAEMEAA